jgi:DNA polymerase III epsilon subunit-like protein
MKNNFVILDFETGGFKATENPITEVAMMVVEPINFNVVTTWESFVLPYSEEWIITKEALQASQTSMTKIMTGISHKKACAEMIRVFKAANPSGTKYNKPILVGHNIGFDVNFAIVLFALNNKDIWEFIHPCPIDTITELKDTEAGLLAKDESSLYKLGICCERLGIKLVDAHGAMADVKATYEIKKKISLMKRSVYRAMKTGEQVNPDVELKTTRKTNAAKARNTFYFEV